MADRLDVSPTRGNLLQVQAQLEQLQSGHKLLDRKQEVLVQKLLEQLADAEAVEAEMRDRFRVAHKAIRRARMRMGSARLRWLSLTPTARIEAKMHQTSIMGARVPVVRVDIRPRQLPYGLGDTSPALDEARERWLEVLQLLGELTEKVTTVWRLAIELRKTQRRVNALESIIIPQYQDTLTYIEQVLEEENREDIIRAKKVKAMAD